MSATPPSIFTPALTGTPSAPGSVWSPAAGGSPAAPPDVFEGAAGGTPGTPPNVFEGAAGGTPGTPPNVFEGAAGGTPGTPPDVFAPASGGSPAMPPAAFAVGSSSAIPNTLTATGVAASPNDGTWLNGAWTRIGDENGFPAWIRVVGNLMGKVFVNEPVEFQDPLSAEWYYVTCYNRADAESEWTAFTGAYAPSAEGPPWEVGFLADGDYSGNIAFVKATGSAMPPAIFNPA